MRLALALICILISGQISISQNAPHPVEESAARKNLLKHPDPVYPPIAKAAHIQGTVEVAVIVDSTGNVKWEKVLSGPAMLQQAALDAIHRWTFKPFLQNGAAVSVSATFEIPFQIDRPGEGPTKEQEEAAQTWFPLSDKCRAALKAQNKEDSISFCKQSLDTSLRAGDLTNSDQLARVESHQYYGHALLMSGRFQEALEQESSAINEAKKCLTEKDQEYAMPFFWRAMAEANLGQVDATLADLKMAEETHRRAIANLPEMKKTYSQYLASILKQHAILLDQLGKTEEAEKLRAEADSL